eukprot:1154480-Pelagomonas_calceolata.AAC.2
MRKNRKHTKGCRFYSDCIVRCVRNDVLHSELNSLPGIEGGKEKQKGKGTDKRRAGSEPQAKN